MELWGGVECTVNRVGDRYFDQLVRTGHHDRLDDLDRLAALGVRAVRYPVLWERSASHFDVEPDFRWADARMERLRALGVRVIVGLVHHGSGPPGTDLLDAGFAEGLARFAGKVARRYPWVEDFTPVNEPLTTARFSGLYGHWYPHRRDAGAFLGALVHEMQATVAAMRAVRAVTPGARLVQTEDLGTVFATPRLQYQAAFENERRWLSLDLLHGYVVPEHPLWHHLVAAGVDPAALFDFCDAPCRPSVVGINYYVTSDRFLDERTQHYPRATHGGNGRDRYADVEAVRVERGIVGHAAVLRAAWERYGTPVALTEVHLGCAEDEQVAWLREAWAGAETVGREGARVEGVTLWSLFGAYDWSSLVTLDRGHYEAGAFDVRDGQPRPTLLARCATELAVMGRSERADGPWSGWWRRPERVLYRPGDEVFSVDHC